jgi:hypothetical protein
MRVEERTEKEERTVRTPFFLRTALPDFDLNPDINLDLVVPSSSSSSLSTRLKHSLLPDASVERFRSTLLKLFESRRDGETGGEGEGGEEEEGGEEGEELHLGGEGAA